jgi:hypothetical protein
MQDCLDTVVSLENWDRDTLGNAWRFAKAPNVWHAVRRISWTVSHGTPLTSHSGAPTGQATATSTLQLVGRPTQIHLRRIEKVPAARCALLGTCTSLATKDQGTLASPDTKEPRISFKIKGLALRFKWIREP